MILFRMSSLRIPGPRDVTGIGVYISYTRRVVSDSDGEHGWSSGLIISLRSPLALGPVSKELALSGDAELEVRY